MSLCKYVDRHKDKGGFQSLLKALSFLWKLMEYYYPQEYQQWREERDAYIITKHLRAVQSRRPKK